MLARLAGLCLTGLAACAAAVAAQAPAGPAIVPLDLSGPRPIAMLKVGEGAPVPVIFDTGASGHVLDSDFARTAGLPEEGAAHVGTPAGGPPMIGFRTRVTGLLGDASLANVPAVALPMPAMRGLSVSGVFGPSTFSGRLVHLDLARSQIRVTDRTPETIPAGAPYPYSDDGPRSLPAMTVEIGGRSFDAHIDTGNPGLLTFPTALAESLPLDGPLRPRNPARLADGVPRNAFDARLRGTVRVGPLTFENPEVRFMDGLRRVNVGMAALRGSTIVLDPEQRRSWLIPNS